MQGSRPGDGGLTKNALGSTVAKSSDQVEAYGMVDELSSILGWARQTLAANDKQKLYWLQEKLQISASCLAGSKPTEQDILSLQNTVTTLEQWTQELEANLLPLRQFAIPGNNEDNARLHVARATARSCERATVRCRDAGCYQADAVLPVLNRLSDYLFVLARTYEN